MTPRPRAHLASWALCLSLAAAAATLLLTSSCQRGNSLAGACNADTDCDAGFHCVRGTGVCITSTTPLNTDAGLDASDAAFDGASDLSAAAPRD
ncbi:MAG TPA: hypothetical protein VH877_04715 [Polyangia bacterium]|nr:hypothetical protein [Polyangia bacterium]